MGFHVNTGFALIGSFLIVGVGALLATIANVRMNDIASQVVDDKLDSARTLSLWAYILGWIAAGLLLLLSFFYFTHGSIFQSEWPHLIFFILIVGGIIAAGILALLAAGDLKDSSVTDEEKQSSDTLLYWAAGLMGAGLLVIIITGIWRVQYKGSNRCVPQYQGEVLPADCATQKRVIKKKTTFTRHDDMGSREHFPQFVNEPATSPRPTMQPTKFVNSQGTVERLPAPASSPRRMIRETVYAPRDIPVSQARAMRQ